MDTLSILGYSSGEYEDHQDYNWGIFLSIAEAQEYKKAFNTIHKWYKERLTDDALQYYAKKLKSDEEWWEREMLTFPAELVRYQSICPANKENVWNINGFYIKEVPVISPIA